VMTSAAPNIIDERLLLLDAADNVLAIRRAIGAGETLTVESAPVVVERGAGIGFKVARTAIRTGDLIVKYGAVIGVATADIAAGQLVHTHNVASRYMPSTEPLESRADRDSSG